MFNSALGSAEMLKSDAGRNVDVDDVDNVHSNNNNNNIDGDDTADSVQRTSTHRVWIKDFPALYVEMQSNGLSYPAGAEARQPAVRRTAADVLLEASISQNASSELSAAVTRELMAGTAGRRMMLRMMVYPLTGKPFPQCHKVVLTSPLEDSFFHWTFLCTPFSFRSLVRNMRWDMPEMAGDSESQAFDQFGKTVRDRVSECAMMPERFVARLSIDRTQSCAVLKFSEVVKEYRRIDLLALEFRPSDWTDIVNDVKTDYMRIKDYHDDVKSALVQVLDTVSRYQPSLLLTPDLGPEVLPTRQPAKWVEALNHILPQTIIPNQDRRMMTEQERITRKKAFILTTQPDEHATEALFSKTANVRITNPEDHKDQDVLIEPITFTFCTRGRFDCPDAYYIVATKQNDVFFHFTSEDITPERFLEMTRHTQTLTLSI
eukprot:jgi/Hompol1/6599/HPOL_001396-RA